MADDKQEARYALKHKLLCMCVVCTVALLLSFNGAPGGGGEDWHVLVWGRARATAAPRAELPLPRAELPLPRAELPLPRAGRRSSWVPRRRREFIRRQHLHTKPQILPCGRRVLDRALRHRRDARPCRLRHKRHCSGGPRPGRLLCRAV